MRLAHKFFQSMALMLIGLAISATTASAQVELLEEDGGHCPAVTKIGHHVEGGCVVEYQSTGEVVMFAHVPGIGPVQLTNCELHFEARVGEGGEGWVTQSTVTSHPSPSFPCTRTACDEAGDSNDPHAVIPAEFVILETGGVESGELRFCFRPTSNPEGVGGAFCTMHATGSDTGNHGFELGDPETETHCEPGDIPFDVWVTNSHFVVEEGPSSNVELVH